MSAALRCAAVSKSYLGVRAVDQVNLSIEAGTIVGLVGPNGAGKTTLFDLITGFTPPDAGDISFESHAMNALPPFRRARLGITRTFQIDRLVPDMTVCEHLMVAASTPREESFIRCLLQLSSMDGVLRERTSGWLQVVGLYEQRDTSAHRLSLGQQKLLTLACCLASGAKFLLLDEPLAGLSPAAVETVLELFIVLRAEHSKTLFLIEHNLDAVMSVSDRVLAMSNGRLVVDDTPDALGTHNALVEVFLG